MYPRDAITIATTTRTSGTYVLIPATTTPITILHGTINSADASDHAFVLGNISILKSSAGDLSIPVSIPYTNVPLSFVKSGNATTTFGVTVVYRDRRVTYDPPYTNQLQYNDAMFVFAIFLFMASIAFWRFLLPPIKPL